MFVSTDAFGLPLATDRVCAMQVDERIAPDCEPRSIANRRSFESQWSREVMELRSSGILVAGGYGVVGRRIAADLAFDYPGRVIVAGRRIERADTAAKKIGYGVRGRTLDIAFPASIAAALHDVGLVVSCIDQPGRTLLNAAVARGLCYTDITPHLAELGRGAAYEMIVATARASGAHVVLGAGIVPGISNVMARALVNKLGGAEKIETALLLAAGDVTGPASFDCFLQELTMPFDIHIEGADRPAHAFSEPRRVEFPAPIGWQTAYLFPFSDQVLYPRTMSAESAISRLAIEPAWLAKLLALMVRTGAANLVGSRGVRRAIAATRRDRASDASSRFALRVDVAHGGRSSHATLLGYAQADAAAAGATGVVHSLLEGDVCKPGAWMPEQAVEPGPFFAHLAARGLVVALADRL